MTSSSHIGLIRYCGSESENFYYAVLRKLGIFTDNFLVGHPLCKAAQDE